MTTGLFAQSNTRHFVHRPFHQLGLAHIATRATTRRNTDNVAEAFAEGFTIAETAALLEMTVTQVGAYLTRIRARLGPQSA